jgi:hypothetical protein
MSATRLLLVLADSKLLSYFVCYVDNGSSASISITHYGCQSSNPRSCHRGSRLSMVRAGIDKCFIGTIDV